MLTFIKMLWGLAGLFPALGEGGIWPGHVRGSRNCEGRRWSCEFRRDCPRCAHWSVCLFHVCFSPHTEMLPGGSSGASRGGLCDVTAWRGTWSVFCNQGENFSSLVFSPRFPSIFFLLASDPFSMTSWAPSVLQGGPVAGVHSSQHGMRWPCVPSPELGWRLERPPSQLPRLKWGRAPFHNTLALIINIHSLSSFSFILILPSLTYFPHARRISISVFFLIHALRPLGTRGPSPHEVTHGCWESVCLCLMLAQGRRMGSMCLLMAKPLS